MSRQLNARRRRALKRRTDKRILKSDELSLIMIALVDITLEWCNKDAEKMLHRISHQLFALCDRNNVKDFSLQLLRCQIYTYHNLCMPLFIKFEEPNIYFRDGKFLIKIDLLQYRQIIVGKNRIGMICRMGMFDFKFRTISQFSICDGWNNYIQLKHHRHHDDLMPNTRYLHFQFNAAEFAAFLSRNVEEPKKIVLCPILRHKNVS